MVRSGSFGRRISSEPQRRYARTRAQVAEQSAEHGHSAIHIEQSSDDAPSLDEELREWKQSRKHGFRMPWRQLSLMASLCFGIASFVLPDSVNENVQWLLYALTAASLIAGFSRRRRDADN
jgi:ATP-dependent exoDNAse (exonuclease V) beta subunit